MEIKAAAFDYPSSNEITLYHGSTSVFDKIDVNCGKPYKDFGKGFYTSRVKSHAVRLVKRNQLIESRNKENVLAYLYTYLFDLNNLKKLNVKEFKEANIEWIQFVLKNRKSRNRIHNFDIVIGPTADDDTLLVISAYFDGLYGKIGSDSALETLIKNIEAENLPNQIYFGTNEAASLLIRKCEVERL